MSSALELQILREARARVARGWCQGTSGEDGDGNAIEPWSPAAQRWSAAGALIAVWDDLRKASSNREDTIAAFQQANLSLLAVVGGQLRVWNDMPSRTRNDVVTAFDRAIERTNPD